jgi:hypothetical protein
MIVFLKAHPVTQAMSRAATPADLNEGDIRRNPGEPDAEQAESSVYTKPRFKWRGLTIAVENPAGSVRRGRNRHGVTWEVRMRFDYGEILNTIGVDGDPVDVIIGPNLDAPEVYVVHQRRVNDWENYDEDKVCVGFDSQSDAESAFLSNYNDPRFLGPVTAMPVDEFVTKVRATKDKPAMIKALLLKTHVAGYTKQDGTFVPPHEDKRQSLQDDLQRQEKWLTAQAVAMGYSDIEDMLEKDYPAFERLALQWREQNPVEVAMKSMVLFFKGYVGSYLRGGRMVQGYQGRVARAVAMPGQRSLFDEPQHTEPTRELIAEHKRLVDVLNSPSHKDDKVEAKKQAEELTDMKQEVATTKPGVTDRAGDLARRLRDAVDKAAPADRRADMYASEAQRVRGSAAKMAGTPDVARQYSEAADILDGWAKTAAPDHSHLLSDMPGATFSRGKGRIAGHYAVDVGGETMSNYHEKPEHAVAQAKEWLGNRAASEKAKADRAVAVGAMRDRLMAGGEATDSDLKLMGLKDGSSGLTWFIPAAAEVFGISSRAVRPHIKDMIRAGTTDMGAKLEFVSPKKALAAVAAGLKPPKSEPDAVDRANPRKKYYVTMIREGNPRQVARLAGPFDRHEDALAHVERARSMANEVDPRSAFDAFGTAGVESDEHRPGVLNGKLGIGSETPSVAKDADDEDHPAPIPRHSISHLSDSDRAKWVDLHRRQHELSHYERHQVAGELERARKPLHAAESEMKENEFGASQFRKDALPGWEDRAAAHDRAAGVAREKFMTHQAKVSRLADTHASLTTKINDLGKQKDAIIPGSGDLFRNLASGNVMPIRDRKDHVKSAYLKYRAHYADQAKKQPMAKSVVFLSSPR